jgi:hypothetical protein
MTDETKNTILKVLDETKELVEDECIAVAVDNLRQLILLLTDKLTQMKKYE